VGRELVGRGLVIGIGAGGVIVEGIMMRGVEGRDRCYLLV